MRATSVLLCTTAFWLLFGGVSSSQVSDHVRPAHSNPDRWFLSVDAGVRYAHHEGGFATTDGTYTCCGYGSGSGVDGAIGIGAWFPIAGRFFFSPRIGYGNIGGTFHGEEAVVPILGRDHQLETMRTVEELVVSLPSVTFDPRIAFTMDEDGLFVFVSPQVTWILSQTSRARVTILDPPDVVFADGERSTAVGARVGDARSLQFALTAGAGWKLALDESLHLLPQVSCESYRTDVMTGTSWNLFSIGGRLEIRYSME